MSKIVSILQSIGNFFASVVDFVVQLLTDLVNVIILIGETVVKLPEYFNAFLPSEVVALLVAAFTVIVIYKVLGRD